MCDYYMIEIFWALMIMLIYLKDKSQTKAHVAIFP